MPESHFQFYTKPEYYADLIKRLNQAQPGDRFITANMVTWPWRAEVAGVLSAMRAAARRGASVTLITDAHNFLVHDDNRLQPGPLLFHRRLPSRGMASQFQMQLDAFEELKADGGRYVILNQPAHPFSLPVAGRSHLKFTVINDRFYIGGCNLESYQMLDMMVGATDLRIANWLSDLSERLLTTADAIAAIGSSDVTYEGPPGVTFYLDAGVRHRSRILGEALAFVDQAQEYVTFISRFFPAGIMGRHLRAARARGVKVNIIYNRPVVPKTMVNAGFMAAELVERLYNPPEFFRQANRGPGYIHAKLVATEQGAIVGSHNFVTQGVALGTAEIAMLVRDPEFARRAVETVMRQLPHR